MCYCENRKIIFGKEKIKGNKLYVDGSVHTRLTLQESADTVFILD